VLGRQRSVSCVLSMFAAWHCAVSGQEEPAKGWW
jgi:hypothetical protein